MRKEHPLLLPKLCGGDIELANFIVGLRDTGDTGREAARALLRQVNGVPLVSKRHAFDCGCTECRPDQDLRVSWGDGLGYGRWAGARSNVIVYDPQDIGRRFLVENGGCIYIDLNHLEICLPEVLSAEDHLAAWHAMLALARQAQVAAAAELPQGQELHVLVNNSDSLGHSYGSHLNFLVTRTAWDNLFRRKLHHLLFLASYQVSSIVFTGAGKVGAENGAPAVDFQISQRSDFFETLTSEMTTFRRPLVNSRDEALCGRSQPAAPREPADVMARLHCIFFDSNLQHVAHLLKVGVMQMILTLVEAEEVDTSLVLDDPLDAVLRWSHDPGLSATARTTDGRQLTAVELQFRFLEKAAAFAERGGFDGIVPDHANILKLWEDTLAKLQARDLDALARRLDWVLKERVLRQAMDSRPGLTWDSPAIRHLDQIYGSLDPEQGLFWACQRAGKVDRLVPDERIQQLTDNPPEDTRAWTRAMLLRRAGADRVDDVDWDRVRIRSAHGGYRTVDLPSPLDFGRAVTEDLFRRCGSLEEILDGLGALESTATRGTGWPLAPIAPGSSSIS